MNFIQVAKKLKQIMLEMAIDRKTAINKLSNLSDTYTQHILKLMLWGTQNEEWTSVWCKEIYNYLVAISDIDLKNNKRLKQNDYEAYFFYINLESESELQNKLNRASFRYRDTDGYPLPDHVNIKVAYNSYKKFVSFIIPQVVSGYIRQQDVKDACKRLAQEVR